MKKLIVLLCLFLICQNIFPQIVIEDKSADPTIKPVKYNGEFFDFSDVYDVNKKAGVVGELVTILDVNSFNLYYNEEDLAKNLSLSSKLEQWFSNKTFQILEYRYENGDILKIKFDDDYHFIWKVSITDKYVFNKYIDVLKDKFEGKEFVSLRTKIQVADIDENTVEFSGDKLYQISQVKFAKLKYDYGIIFRLNDSLDFIFPTKNHERIMVFDGVKYTINDNYISLKSGNGFALLLDGFVLIEKNEFRNFSQENSSFLAYIRNGQVKVGMSIAQCRLAWGIPTKSMQDFAGYDDVLIYGSGLESKNLFFKQGKLVAIK